MQRWMYIMIWCSLTSALVAQVKHQNAYLSIDSSVFFIGDLIPLNIVAELKSEQLFFPDIAAGFSTIEQLEIVEEMDIELKRDGAWNRFTKSLLIRIWEPGRYSLPPFHLKYVQQSDTIVLVAPSIYVSVLAPQITGDSTYIADIKPLFVEKPGGWDFIMSFVKHPLSLVLALVLAVFFLIVVVSRYFNQPVNRSPEEMALSSLAALKQRALLSEGHFLLFHEQLSYIWRRYLSERFYLKTLRSPLNNCLRSWDWHPWLSAAQYASLRLLLEHADLIKFAKACPLKGVSKHDLIFSEQLVVEIQHLVLQQIDPS